MSQQITEVVKALKAQGYVRQEVRRADGPLKPGMIVWAHPSGHVFFDWHAHPEVFEEPKAEAGLSSR
jgi:hypothetical protein